MEITWRDKTITCEEGTTLFDISKQVEKEYEFPIIVAKVDGVIQELYHEVIDGTTVSFCTTKDSDGKRAYIRGMSICFNEQDVRPMGRTARGVIGIKLKGVRCRA